MRRIDGYDAHERAVVLMAPESLRRPNIQAGLIRTTILLHDTGDDIGWVAALFFWTFSLYFPKGSHYFAVEKSTEVMIGVTS